MFTKFMLFFNTPTDSGLNPGCATRPPAPVGTAGETVGSVIRGIGAGAAIAAKYASYAFLIIATVVAIMLGTALFTAGQHRADTAQLHSNLDMLEHQRDEAERHAAQALTVAENVKTASELSHAAYYLKSDGGIPIYTYTTGMWWWKKTYIGNELSGWQEKK